MISSRRNIIKIIIAVLAMALFRKFYSPGSSGKVSSHHPGSNQPDPAYAGSAPDGYSHIYYAQGKSPELNMQILLASMGGIEKFIGADDIVIVKPNAQWWNQGTTNTNALKAFIGAIVHQPGFRGEVIVAENHQYDEPNSRGWTTELRNGDFNLNELIGYFKEQGVLNVTKYHWRPVKPLSRKSGLNLKDFSRIVEGPWQGDGYVYDPKLIYTSPLGRRCMLTYPIFTSSFSGKVIDFKNGVWENGAYSGQPVKFINFTGINHHGSYCGVTASVKNYMGVVDMSCGSPRGNEGFFNVHHLGVRDLPRSYTRIIPRHIQGKLEPFWEKNYTHSYFHHTGGCLGAFMRMVRMADLNIIAVHWAGYGSRTDTSLSGYPEAIVASTDPVALDYWAAREILLPLTNSRRDGIKFARLNDPDYLAGPFRKFLQACHEEKIGNLDSGKIRVHHSS